MRGKLIILFGIDGSGKTTVLNMLKLSNFSNIMYSSCMSNSVFEEELYTAEMLLHFSRKDIYSREYKHWLHIGGVIYNMYNKILPMLEDGINVVLDRYTICIRLFANLFLEPSFFCITEALKCLPFPDLGIYFDTDVDVAAKRILMRNENALLHYSESKDALLMKKKGYEEMIKNEPYKIRKVNSNQNIHIVYNSVVEILKKDIYI